MCGCYVSHEFMEYMSYLFGMCWSSTGTCNLREIHLCTEKQEKEKHTHVLKKIWIWFGYLVRILCQNSTKQGMIQIGQFYFEWRDKRFQLCLAWVQLNLIIEWAYSYYLGFFMRMALGVPSPFLILIIYATFVMHNLGRRLCKVQGYCQPLS